ncbi:response regulator [Gracilibacillus caseinilyticus]|uniref:Response regulator n=1 Tax=Gracilibacillus caseinilyticus TaxID=2932256 RepID=A0ABY4EQE2_9BACI|nr:response regulator [Gracilibacillus caseinilyticus]UOQ46657.1 response regulator [Gracilibacillus caseinilyticus]
MKTILIIDDELSVRQGLSRHVDWQKLRLNVIGTASDGKQALEMINKDRPDIVITDIYMPEMDGLTLIKHLYEQYSSIKIIIHSGYNHFDNARKAIQYGVKHFFLKPSPVSEIETIMQDVLQEMEADDKKADILNKYTVQRPVYLAYRKDSFIRQLLFNHHSLNDRLSHTSNELLGISTNTAAIVTSIMINRPPYLTKAHEREWQLMKFSVGNILSETMERFNDQRELVSHLVDYSDSSYVLVMFLPGNSLYLEQINDQLVQKMVDHVLYYLKVSMMVGVSEVKSNIHQLTDAYGESMQALEVSEYEEWNHVYHYNEMKKRGVHSSESYPFEMVKEINEAITSKDYEVVLDIWNNFVNDISSATYLPFYLIQTISINVLSVLLMEEQYSDNGESDLNEAVLLQGVYHHQTTKALLDWMLLQLKDWVERSKQFISNQKTSHLVDQVKEHVHQYYDELITLGEIAEEFHVNRNYLSQLFKKTTGETFVHYLNQYRINKAKELLREKRYMVYEVSEMVGYQNSTYFSQVFKAIVGISPSEFF